MQEQELYHYGILGMKWGVRRFQNKDGTRTAAGKKRERAARSTDSMSDEELRSKINRLQNEQDYQRILLNRDKSNAPQSLRNTSNALRIGGSLVQIGDAVTGGKSKEIKDLLDKTQKAAGSAGGLADQIQNVRQNPEIKFNLKNMTDDELRRRVDRLRMEDRYDQLMAAAGKRKVSFGERFVKALPIATAVIGFAGSAVSLGVTIANLIQGNKTTAEAVHDVMRAVTSNSTDMSLWD